DAGPNRSVHHLTASGRAATGRWLDRPVEHIRDLRIEFLIKLRLNQRRHRNPQPLIAAQRAELTETFDHLTRSRSEDVVDTWRNINATAARQFLDYLAIHGVP
ncbi:MAG: PadR family transcriptional regulator, partial [Acidimicrobiales bacterium]